jgi:kynureninase
MNLSDLRKRPNALSGDYRHFDVANRLLLTGHSHQAWPDCGFAGQQQAWLDAASQVDGKWSEAFSRAERVRQGYSRLLGEGSAGHIALGASTHELLVRLLSALPLRERPRIVTTEGEFHTARRQLDRLEEEGVEIVRVPTDPHEDVADRVAARIDDGTCLALVSSVFYGNARRVTGLDRIMSACRKHGADLLVDVYHHLNVLPFSLAKMDLEDAFVVGGGYKYCQLGEGNAFLRFPESRKLRPVVTGWFAEFSALADTGHEGPVPYDEGAASLAGATYDPTSHYRASEVFDFFEERGLTPDFLRKVSRHQVGALIAAFDGLDADPALIHRDRGLSPGDIAGFLSLHASRAGEIRDRLRERGVHVDSRGDVLRLGPAPYLDDGQLRDAIGLLGEVIGEM